MAEKMKALKTFSNKRNGTGKVRAGREFDAVSKDYADYLERAGLAARVSGSQPAAAKKPAANPAASKGPLSGAGGKTGVKTGSQSSSGPARAPQKPGSSKSKGAAASQ